MARVTSTPARRARAARVRRLAIASLLLGSAASAHAMPMLLAVAATYAVSAAATAAIISATTAMFLNAAIFVGTLVYGAVEQRRAKEGARNAYNASLTDRYAPVMSAAQAPWQIIYGECVVAPCQVAAQLTSGDRDQFKHVVYVWAAHQCEAITDTLIAGQSVGALDANGWVTAGKYFRTQAEVSEPIGALLDGSGSATLPYAPGQVQNISWATGLGENDLYEYLTVGQFTLVGAVLTVGAPYVAAWAGRSVTVNTLRTVNTSVLRVRHHLGTSSQAADAALLAEVPADWTSTDKLLNLCYSVVTYGLDEPEFQSGPPDLKVRVKGKLLFDDRTSSTGWSTNVALAVRDFLRAEYGKHCTSNQLDAASAIAAANVCDEALASQGGAARYTVNGAFRTDMDPDATLDALCQAMGGFVAWDGGQWKIQAGAYAAPVQALTDADNWGPVEVIADRPGDELFNGLKGRFFDPARFDQLTDYTPYQNAAYVTADGAALWDDLDLPFTNAHWRAHNLARILVERSRGMQLVYPAKLTAVKLRVGQRVTLANSVLGIAGAAFRIVKREYRVGGPVRLTLQQDDATIWDEADAVAPLDSPAVAAPDPFAVLPVAGLTLTTGDGVRVTLGDGTVASGVLVGVTASDDALVTAHGALQIEYRIESATAWQRWPEAPGTATEVLLQGLKDGRRYIVRARWRNGLGAVGDWRVKDVLVNGKSTAPGNVAGFTGSKVPGGLLLQWNKNSEIDFAATELHVESTWSDATAPVYRGRGVEYLMPWPTAGAMTVKAKHIDTSGNYSASAASVTVTIDGAILIDTDELAPGAATGIGSSYVASASVTDDSHVPDGFGFQTKVASVTLTPTPGLTPNVDVCVTASLKWSVAGSGGNTAYGWLGLHDGTFSGWRNNELVPGGVASGSTRTGIATFTHIFSTPGNTSTEYALYGKRQQSSDTVTISDVDFRVEVIRR